MFAEIKQKENIFMKLIYSPTSTLTRSIIAIAIGVILIIWPDKVKRAIGNSSRVIAYDTIISSISPITICTKK